MKTRPATSWRELLAEPGDDGHIVQLYQDDNFYSEAISHFAAEGIVRGESIILVATRPHWENISRRMESKGFETAELFHRGQLTLLDADATLPKFMAGNDPDGNIFKPLARQTIAKARAGGKYPRVRWWGEMVNVLYVNGNPRGSNRLEQLFDQVAHEESIAIFCSFLMDKFDPKIYEEAFGNVCKTHSHVIPADDYVQHRLIVNRAIAEVIGDLRPAQLQSLKSWQGATSLMPSSQSLLLWIREKMPEYFGQVLTKARQLETEAVGARVRV
jgi:DcmR-like sensory protein